jgi:hypothetical protein
MGSITKRQADESPSTENKYPRCLTLCNRSRCRFHGPIMVQQLFPSAPNTLQGAIRVALFQLVTGKRSVVTALSGSFGHSWAAVGTEGNSPARTEQCMRGRSLARRTVKEVGGEPAIAECYCTKLKCSCKQLIINKLLVEATGVELITMLITRKLLILGTATTAKKPPLPNPLYVYCTKMLSLWSRTDTRL